MICAWCEKTAKQTVVLEPSKAVTRGGRKSYTKEKAVPACDDHAERFSGRGYDTRRGT